MIRQNEAQFLLELLKPYRSRVLLFLAGSILVALFDGISIGLLVPVVTLWQSDAPGGDMPGFLDQIADLLQPYSSDWQFILLVLLVIGAIFLKNVLFGLTVTQGLWVSNRINADVRARILKILLAVGIDYHHRSKSGELLDKAINYTHVLKMLFIALTEFVVFALMSLILFVLLFAISWQLTLVTLVLGLIFTVLLSGYMKRIPALGMRTAETSRELTNAVQESLSAIRLIQANNKQQQQFEHVWERIDSHAHADFRAARRVALINPITEVLGAIGMGLLLIGSWILLPTDARLSVGMLLPFLYILLRNVYNLRLLYSLRGNILAQWPYLKLIHDLLREDNKPFIAQGSNEFTGLKQGISFDSVTFTYVEKMVLEDVSFAIPQGKITAIVGKSGAGKSTLVNLLLRFYDPQQGFVRIDGRPLTDFRPASYLRAIGVVSQDTFIFNQSVRENISFALEAGRASEADIVSAAKKAGAHAFIMQLPQGYDTPLGDRGIKLSGGQRQRISIARAILKNPEILILDEATSALDSITERSVHEAILELQHNRTVIIIAHRLSTIKNADQIVVLNEGRVAEAGTSRSLLAKGDAYFNLVQAG